MFGLIDPGQFEVAFRTWVKSLLPALGAQIVGVGAAESERTIQSKEKEGSKPEDS